MTPFRNYGEPKVRQIYLVILPILISVASSYSSSPKETSFLSYFASTTPDSEHKQVRLKTILLLQGSSLYEPAAIRESLLGSEKALRLELAIVDGKVRSIVVPHSLPLMGSSFSLVIIDRLSLGWFTTSEMVFRQRHIVHWAGTWYLLKPLNQ
jgi:hypothetical protein